MQGISIKQWYGAAFFSGNLGLWYGYARPHWLLLFLFVFIWVAHRHKATFLAVVFLIGFICPLMNQLIDNTVIERLAITKHKYLLSGEIVSWVQREAESSRFTFEVGEVNHSAIPDTVIQLTCYANCHLFKLGERWQLLVKLSPAVGFANPVGFDYERWLFSNNIKARGYFVDSAFNQHLGDNQGIPALRLHLKQRLQSTFFDPLTQGGILAMLLGDRTLLDSDARQGLRNTGTGHLIAISGLHVGLAGSMGYAIAVLVWRYASRKEHVIAKQSIAWSCAVIVALIYAIISGLGMPAQRALVMLAVFAISHLIGRHWSLGQRFNLALCVVLVLQPKAVLDIGFWLSFVVTGILVIYVKLAPCRHYISGLVILQLVLCISLSALQSIIFEQVALASLFYNLWAIPLVSVVLLPLSMVWLLIDSTLFVLFSGLDVAHVLTWLVDSVYGIFWWGLAVTELAQHSLIYLSLAPVAVIIMPVAVFCIRLASSWRTRLTFVWLLGLCLFPRIPPTSFKMTVLDVGQGLAIVISSQQEAMLYDTGYGDINGSRVQSIVMPYLRHLNINQLSSVVISHDDNDHAGGLSALQAQIPFNSLIVSPTAGYGTDNCFRNLNWQLGDAQLSVLSPESDKLYESDNNNSCVVLLEIYGKHILLTGDIEYQAERAIVNQYPTLRADILVVPHHGSETSSSWGFIKQIRPKIAINSSAYMNRFGLPSAKVRKRYQHNDVLFYDTQTDGAIEINISDDGDMQISSYRQQNPALWGRNCYISQNYFVIQNEKDLKGC